MKPDTRNAIDSLFEKPIVCIFINIGVETDLSDLPESMTFALDKPFIYAEKENNIINFNNYVKYKDYTPKE